jgi:hypothetical protein
MKVQTEAGEMDRARPARKILLSAKLHVPHAQRTLKGVQLELSVPELHERQAHLRKNQSLNLYGRRNTLQPEVTLDGSREAQI